MSKIKENQRSVQSTDAMKQLHNLLTVIKINPKSIPIKIEKNTQYDQRTSLHCQSMNPSTLQKIVVS